MTPVRLLVQISVFCVFCLFITRVRFPVMPVADVENIIVKGSQIKCDSGCELMKEKINQMSCYRKNHGNSGSKDQDDNSVSVSDYDYEVCLVSKWGLADLSAERSVLSPNEGWQTSQMRGLSCL